MSETDPVDSCRALINCHHPFISGLRSTLRQFHN